MLLFDVILYVDWVWCIQFSKQIHCDQKQRVNGALRKLWSNVHAYKQKMIMMCAFEGVSESICIYRKWVGVGGKT